MRCKNTVFCVAIFAFSVNHAISAEQNAETITVHGTRVIASGYDMVSAAVQTVELDDNPFPATTLTDALLELDGIETSGQGGWFQVFSVRGVSRNRVVTFLSGIPIYTERRAGSSVHFIDPALLERATVISGPATSIYGVGAIGGVVQLEASTISAPRFGLRYDSNGDGYSLYGGTGGETYSLGVAYQKQDDSEAANGLLLNDHGERWSTLYRQQWQAFGGKLELLAMPAKLDDVGRVNADFYDGTVTETPEEQHLPLRLSYTDNRFWQAAVWLHDSEMTTVTTEIGNESNAVENLATDYGVNVHRLLPGEQWNSRIGVEYAARRSVNADESLTDLNTMSVTERAALADGEEAQLGLFAETETVIGNSTLQFGVRWTEIEQSAAGFSSISDQAVAMHAGWSYQQNDAWMWTIGVGSAYRFPALTERFYNGMTARGDLLGNADLEPEQAVGIDLGLHARVGAGVLRTQLYHQEFEDYIERINLPNRTRTYVNLAEGEIYGAELSYRWNWNEQWYSELSGHYVHGESGEGEPLSEIPASRVQASVGVRADRCQAELRLNHRLEKDDVGGDELLLDSSSYADISASCFVGDHWRLSLVSRNLNDELYRLNADEQSGFARGRNIELVIDWR